MNGTTKEPIHVPTTVATNETSQSTPKSKSLPSIGTPEATATAPVYFERKPKLDHADDSPTVLAGDVTAPAATATDADHHLLKHYLYESQRAAALQHFGTADVKEAAKMIGKMGQRDLQARFKLVYGQPTHSNNNEWLRRKLCEGIGAIQMRPVNKKKKAASQRAKARVRSRHQVDGFIEGLGAKRARMPSAKMRESLADGGIVGLTGIGTINGPMNGPMREQQALPVSAALSVSEEKSSGGIHIRVSKDGIYRSKSVPSKRMGTSKLVDACRADSSSHFTAANVSGDDDDSYPYTESTLLTGFSSLPVVLHSNSTTDLTELVKRVEREQQQNQANSSEVLPTSAWEDVMDEVLLVDVGAPFNPLTEGYL